MSGIVSKAITALIARGQVCYFVKANKNIATVTEADLNKHTVDISADVPPTTVAVVVTCRRTGGTGTINLYPNEGTIEIGGLQNRTSSHVIAILNQRIQYKLSVINDTFDIDCFGYWVQGDPRS